MADKLCTSIHHLAFQINEQIPKWDKETSKQMLSTGGGTKNQFLFDTIQWYLSENITLVKPGDQLIDFKEAVVFALMGVLKIRNEANCLATVTGAHSDNCGGHIYYPLGFK